MGGIFGREKERQGGRGFRVIFEEGKKKNNTRRKRSVYEKSNFL